MTRPLKFHFIVIVWGAEYIQSFLQVILPNHLSAGNLGAFPGLADCCYKIFTTPEDAGRFQASPAFQRLQAQMPTQVVALPEPVERDDRYERLITFTQQAVREARQAGAITVFLPPDNLYSDGTFPAVARLAAAGKKAVVLPGIRLTQESAAPVFRERWPAEAAPGRPYPARELVRLAMDHLHPLTESLFADAENFHNPWPSHIYWRVPGEGFLCRACHLHPLMIDPGQGDSLGDTTIDGAFLEELCSDPDQVHVVQDSDEMAAFELTPRLQFPLKPKAHANPRRISWFVAFHATDLHREFLKLPIRIHHGDCSPAWAAVEQEAERGLARVRACMPRDLYNAEYLHQAVETLMAEWQARGTRVILYGAGEHTARLFQWTRLGQANLLGLADANAELHGQERHGFRVLSKEAMLALRPELVLVSSFFHGHSIYEDLRDLEAQGVTIQGFYGPLRPSQALEQERL